ncbi:MAG: nuclear transport factor 2 family protein [Myxococcota bacterium]
MADADEVKAAALRFYEALGLLMAGNLDPMRRVWDHGAEVSSGHPIGEWAHGWDEVLATWEELAALSRQNTAAAPQGAPPVMGIRIERVFVLGDVAYTTGVFESENNVNGKTVRMSLNCTNIFRRRDGGWKLIHHHADKAPVVGDILAGALS